MIYLSFFDIDERVIKASEKAMELCKDKLAEIDDIQEYNQQKMIKAFQLADVRESHLWGSTGYGYDDAGREALDKVYAYVFDAEDALVRHNFVSGTHALTVALFGVLRPGDTMFSVTGMPYDTIRSAIGIEGDYPGSLKDFSINFEMTELNPDGTLDYDKIASDIAEKKPKMVYIQRSRGYSTRPTLTWREIKKLCEISKANSPESIIMLDNCYGEFIDKVEPLSVGVDMMAGSLIKNPGGGIAPTGGFIAGKKEIVEMCAYRLTTPVQAKKSVLLLTQTENFLWVRTMLLMLRVKHLKLQYLHRHFLKFSVMKQVLSTMMQEEISFSLSCSVMQKRYAVFARVFRAVRLLTALYLRFRRICRVTKVR